METMPATTSAGVQLPAVELAGVTWSDAVEAYLTNASRSGSEHTRRAYRRRLEAFADAELVMGERQLAPIRTLGDVTPAHLMAWRAHVMETMRPGSQGQAIAALRGFMRWTGAQGMHGVPSDTWRETLRMPPAHEPRPYSVLTDAEIVRLFDAVDTATTAKGQARSAERRQRDTAILAVMLGAGLRAAEVVALEVRDVAAGEGGVVLAVAGKGGKRREVPIREDVARPILRYLHTTGRRLGDAGALFTREGDRTGGYLTTRTVGMLTAQYADAAGIEAARAFSPHACRHTYAVRAAREGLTVAALRRALGHSSVATTGRYLDHIALADLRDSLPNLPTRESVGG
jgi:site-specific recombinase XerD